MTPGGGGLGATQARDPALVDQDAREERTSR
jgi:N-methylhydantoinase B/oxoprolinase/acetone carboxylase alpha subunit